MQLRSLLVDSVRLPGEDAALYRDEARHRDRVVLRVIAGLVVTGQLSRLFFDWNLSPDLVTSGLPYRLAGVLCFLALFALSFHRVTVAHLHAVVGTGFFLGTMSLAKAYAEAQGQTTLVNTTIGIALLLLGAFSFGRRLALLIGLMALLITTLHMPLAGLGGIALVPRLVGSGVAATVALAGSWLLDRYWRRAFLVERDLARSHESLRQAHRELADAHATLKATQAQLVKMEKTAALGRLVAGVAHRINAPVGIQVSLASHLVDTAERFSHTMAQGGMRRSDLARFVDGVHDVGTIVLENARRMAHLVDTFKQLESGAGQPAAELDVGDLLARARPLLEAMMPPGITLVVDAPGGLRVRGDSTLLDTIVYQTVGNAMRHAFPDRRAGTVTVRAGRDADGNVVLTIADDGCGIRPEHLEHVFDPFYTNGAIGGGEGLGLSIVHNAVVGPLGGRIAIDSREGQGTAVTVRLPAATHPAEGVGTAALA
jgi:signal transduction histidine kinase